MQLNLLAIKWECALLQPLSFISKDRLFFTNLKNSISVFYEIPVISLSGT